MRNPFRRSKDEPPGIWRGEPHLYSRWRFGGEEWRLVQVDRAYDYHDPSASRIVLSYEPASPREDGPLAGEYAPLTGPGAPA